MKEFTPGSVIIESASAFNLLNQDRYREGEHYAAYIGLDVHKKTIAVAVAYRGRGKPISRAEILNTPKAIRKLVTQLNQEFGGEILLYSYEAGPCGYDLYHQLTALGLECEVVAPSLIPRKPGDRVKTDKRDAKGLAKYSRSGELTPVWVPGKEQEAMRDLTRAREDIKLIEKMTKQRLGAFLLRHGKIYNSAKSRWTEAYFNWLGTVKFDSPIQQIVMQEYIAAVQETRKREASLKNEMFKALESWSLRPVVEGLIALRGIDIVTAMTIMAELGDISRFNSPKELRELERNN